MPEDGVRLCVCRPTVRVLGIRVEGVHEATADLDLCGTGELAGHHPLGAFTAARSAPLVRVAVVGLLSVAATSSPSLVVGIDFEQDGVRLVDGSEPVLWGPSREQAGGGGGGGGVPPYAWMPDSPLAKYPAAKANGIAIAQAQDVSEA